VVVSFKNNSLNEVLSFKLFSKVQPSMSTIKSKTVKKLAAVKD
jgi:hypothetical protein